MDTTKTLLNKIPKDELENRLSRFCSEMDNAYESWELCIITGGVSLFYLTGTICDGVLIIRRGLESVLWVRRSYDRAVIESEFSNIRQIRSYRDISAEIGNIPETVYIDTAGASMEWYSMFTRYIPIKAVLPCDKVMLKTRSIKSEYELSVMRRAGETVGRILRCDVPSLLRADMSEAELAAELYLLFIKNGYHGISRFSSRNCDFVLGHICFRESPLYPSIFNGASGISGLYPGAPVLGSFEQKLMAGDLVYIDVGFGINGYHVDHTLVYSFKGSQPDVVLRAHQNCLDIERHAASMLRPGVKPSEIYKKALEMVMPEFADCFMGVKGRTVPFIGHGVGLYIDEAPVLAKGFDEPLEKNMTIAIEPKIGLTGYGMTGSENTYHVTDSGRECLTGGVSEIIFC